MAFTIQRYNQFFSLVLKGDVSLTQDDIKVMLVNAYTFDPTQTDLSEVVGSEIAEDNGYLSGGVSLTNLSVSYEATTNTTKWDSNDASWAASGGQIGPTTGAIVYSDTSQNDKLLCYMDFGGVEVAADGANFRLSINELGLLTIG